MKALKYTRRIIFLLTAISAVSMSACDDTAAGIFSRVAAETPISTNMTEAIQGSTPSFVVLSGTTYYAGIGPTLWEKAISDTPTTWKESEIPSGFSGTALANSGAVIDVSGTDTLFVAFSDSTGSSVWSKSDGSSNWIAVTGLPTDRYLRMLLTAHDTLFAITANIRTSVETPENYSIHYLSSSSFSPTNIVTKSDIGLPNSVAFDGSAYWFTAGDSLLTGSSSDLNVLGTEAGSAYAGVCSVGSSILVSNRLGYLYFSSNAGATWVNNSSAFESSTSKAYSFSIPTYFEVGGANTLLVGTNKISMSSVTPDANGYLFFDLNSATFAADTANKSGDTALSTAINFASSLSLKSVNALPYFDIDTTKKQVFALTVGEGLWSNTYSGTSWGGWVRE